MFLHIHCHGIVYAKVYFFGKVYEYTFPKPTKINIYISVCFVVVFSDF